MSERGFSPLKASGKKLDFLTYDLEWWPHSMRVRLCGVFDGKRYRSYERVEEFLNGELNSENRNKVFFAHCGGLSDVQYVLDAIIQLNDPTWKISASFSGSSAVIVRITKGKNNWTFADSFWILKASLREIGNLLGDKKGGSADSEAMFYASLPTLRLYNAQDCKILYRALREFEAETLSLGGDLRLTIASCAMHLFRCAFLKRKIPTSDHVNRLARQSYVASRVEVYGTECNAARVYDIRSSFPKSMTLPLPGGVTHTDRRIRENEPCYMAHVRLTVPDCYIPPLPYRVDQRVFFPHGTWEAWLMAPDVRALEMVPGCSIDKVFEVVHFEPFDDMADYVHTLFALKAEASRDGNKFREATFKFYLNTLYGKTAESREKESLVIGPDEGRCIHSPPCAKDRNGMLTCIRMMRPGVFLRYEEVQIQHEWVPIASQVTASSRLRMLELFLQAKRPRYGDTDSVVVPVECGEFPTGEELGDLKLERMIDGATFLAPKLYSMRQGGEKPDLIKSKGFRRLTPAEFEALSRGDGVLTSRMLRVKEIMASHSTSPREHYFFKHFRGESRPKRAPDGDTDTRPWHVSELLQPFTREEN